MVKAALGSLLGMDIIMMLVDITQPPGKGDEFIINNLPQDETKKFLVLNKIDLVKKHLILPAIGRYREMFEFDEFIPVSALDGDNIELLEETVKNNLKEGPKYFEDDIITDTTERFFAAEIIREKLLNETREEIPYSMAVTIEMWEETDDLLKIHALVFVDRESHKPIIIGEKGSRLKKIGTEARLEMEQVFGIRIYLQIWVKVKRNWRDDDRLLHEIGLNDSR
jgi:GTP-binding protein Era